MAADGLKQRLVGGATLLIVGVIAWFWLLSADSPVDPVARESQIPAAPDIRPFAVPEPAAPQHIEPIGSAREAAPALQSDVVPQAKTAAPAPKPASQKADTVKSSATNPVAAKSSGEPADSSKANAAAQKTPLLKSAPAATKNNEPEATARSESKPDAKAAGKAGDSKLVPETFQLDQHGLPVAWVVQVGLFSTQASADKIKATLQEKGFKAYTEVFKSQKANGIKVFVGPKLSRERADVQKKAIDELLKTNTMVVRFVAN